MVGVTIIEPLIGGVINSSVYLGLVIPGNVYFTDYRLLPILAISVSGCVIDSGLRL